MKKELYVVRLTLLVALCFFIPLQYGCVPPNPPPGPGDSMNNAKKPSAPEINTVPNMNQSEKQEDIISLPKQWNSYRVAIDNLVGTYVALVPDHTSQTGYKVQILDRAITDDGIKMINTRVIEAGQPVYQSRIESKFASDLSFVIGNLSVQADHLYDLSLTDATVATITPDSKYTDKNKAADILKRLSPTYKDLIWVTAVTHRTLAYKEYQKYTGKTDVAYNLVKAGAEYYYGNEVLSVAHTLFFTGLSDAGLFGVRDTATGLYNKKVNLVDQAEGPKRIPISKATIDLFKATSKIGKIEMVK